MDLLLSRNVSLLLINTFTQIVSTVNLKLSMNIPCSTYYSFIAQYTQWSAVSVNNLVNFGWYIIKWATTSKLRPHDVYHVRNHRVSAQMKIIARFY